MFFFDKWHDQNGILRRRPYEGHEFEALKVHFEIQIQNLRNLTQIDLRIFSGYLTLQLVFGGWLSKSAPPNLVMKSGLLIIDITLAFIAWKLLENNYKRRIEIVGTIKNMNEALGFEDKGVYLKDRKINEDTEFRPWRPLYSIGIVIAVVGVSLILFGLEISKLKLPLDDLFFTDLPSLLQLGI